MALAKATQWFDHEANLRAGLEATKVAKALGSPERMGLAACVSLSSYIMDSEGMGEARQLGQEALDALGNHYPAIRAQLLARLSRPWRGFESEAATREAVALARRSGQLDALSVALFERGTRLVGSERTDEPRLGRGTDFRAHAEDLQWLPPSEGRTGLAGDGATHGGRPGRLRGRQGRLHTGLPRRTGVHTRKCVVFEGPPRPSRRPVGRGGGGSPPAPGGSARLFRDRDRVPVGPAWGGAGPHGRGAARGVLAVLEEGPWDRTLRAVVARSYLDLGDLAGARRELEAVGSVGFHDLPDRALSLACLAEVTASLGDTAWAERLSALLHPYAGQLIVGRMSSVCPGAADRYLGQLASILGDWDSADAHFTAAAKLEERISAPPLVAVTRYRQASNLISRDCDGDRAEARALLGSVLSTTHRLQMLALHHRAENLLGSL